MYLKRTHFSQRIQIQKKKVQFCNEKLEKKIIFLVAPFHIRFTQSIYVVKLKRLRGKAKRHSKFLKKILSDFFGRQPWNLLWLTLIFEYGRNLHFWDALTSFSKVSNLSILVPLYKVKTLKSGFLRDGSMKNCFFFNSILSQLYIFRFYHAQPCSNS